MLSLSIENLCTQINKLELLIDAIVPTKLKYGDQQQRYFFNPMKHEIEFAQNLRVGYPKQTLTFGDDTVSPEEISPRCINHLQRWLQLMYHTLCIDCKKNENFDQICYILYAHVSSDPDALQLNLIEVRPCAQKLGLLNLVIGQLLKICINF